MAPQSSTANLQNIWRGLAARPYVALTLAVLFFLGPFLNKPFNIDDPLFLWAARQIQAHPGNPYGYDVNWNGRVQPMWQVTKNPPLACYYVAGAAAVLGWSEFALHLAFLLPAIAAILGTYRLAARFCGRPLLAAGLTLFTPVFLVSSTAVMCDVLMLAFWMWATVLWVEGLERDDLVRLAGSGVLIGLAALTKYYGACLIPLLAVYGVLAKRKSGVWLVTLLIPVAALLVYQMTTRALYGRGMLSDASGYVALTKGAYGMEERVWSGLMALTFTGGCLAMAVFLGPFLWRIPQLAMLAVAAFLVTLILRLEQPIMNGYGALPGSSPIVVEAQIIFWAVGGVNVLALAAADVWRHRDARSWLLAFWAGGTFIFAAFCNWVVNGRSILPMAPAVAILLVRRLELRSSDGKKPWLAGVTAAFAAGAVLALLVAQADCGTAYAVRQSARVVQENFGKGNATLWFRGHWGFQYYLESLGARAYDNKQPAAKDGDYLAVALNNTDKTLPARSEAQLESIMNIYGPRWVSTINRDIGAGFYASVLGPLPFAFGRVPPERVLIYRMGADEKTAPPAH